MVPKKCTAFFRMAGITDIINRDVSEHLPAFSTMRIVTRRAAHLHVAKLSTKQVGRPLEEGFSLFNVAAEASFCDGKADQHRVGGFDLGCFSRWSVYQCSLSACYCAKSELGVMHVVT